MSVDRDCVGWAIVTGGAGDIGAAICRRLSADGWRVVVADRDGEAAAKVAARLATAATREVDVTDRAQVEKLINEFAQHPDGLGMLVNNVGVAGPVQPLGSYPEEAFENVMRTNVHGVFLGMRAALPPMLEAGRGAIVNTASTSAIRGRANLAAYVASKHAVLGLTKVAALEVVDTGVRVNAVLPGPVETQMIQAINADAAKLSGSQGNGLTRAASAPYATVDDVAATVAHLGSSDTLHFNGAAVVVDGGITVA